MLQKKKSGSSWLGKKKKFSTTQRIFLIDIEQTGKWCGFFFPRCAAEHHCCGFKEREREIKLYFGDYLQCKVKILCYA